MVVKVERPGTGPEVLVYWSPTWRTKLFYNTTLRSDTSVEEKCKSSLDEVFRIPPHRVDIDETQGRILVVRKRSEDPTESELGLVEYRFVVQPVVVDGLPRSLLEDGHSGWA